MNASVCYLKKARLQKIVLINTLIALNVEKGLKGCQNPYKINILDQLKEVQRRTNTIKPS